MKTRPSAISPWRPRRRGMSGFSLIEIMVGLVIAMVGVIIMMQVLLTSDARARTTTGGNDALSSGAVMLHMMQRDLVQAGYGINALNLMGCNIVLPTGATLPLAPLVINPPVALIPAGDAHTDTLLTFYGSDNGQPQGNTVYSLSGSSYTMQAPTAFAVDDYVVALPGSCAADLVMTRVTAVDVTTVTVGTAVAGATVLYNLGKTPKIMAYAVRNAALTSCDFMAVDCRISSAASWAAVSGNIVSLRAQYGRDTAAAGAMDGVIDVYDQTTPTTSCGWARTSAVRLALVARSSQYETQIDPGTGQRVCDPVTALAGPTSPTWSGNAGAPIDLTGSATWQCYRYKVFETIAPARNVVWMGVQTGC
jgi:type IV pilus assembly protein PilW